jgi:uncharacterized repeat protein (TIGR01451 family)
MKKRILASALVAVLVLFVGTMGMAQEEPPTLEGPSMASTAGSKIEPGVLARLEAEGQATFVVTLAEQADLSRAYRIRDWEARGWYVLNTLREEAGRTQPAVLDSLDGLRGSGHVVEAHPHYIVNLIVVQGDAEAARAMARLPEVAAVTPEPRIWPVQPVEMSALDSGPQAIEWNIAKIGADQVWATYGITGTGVVVANIDTGVEYAHPALDVQYRGNLGGGAYDHDYNWWDPGDICDFPCPRLIPHYPTTPAHGTIVMGTMVGDDGLGNQIGVAPGAKWIAAFGFPSLEGILSATEWMIAPWQVNDFDPGHPTADPTKRPHAVNNSWGILGGWQIWDALLEAQRAAGIVPVYSAGNSGFDCGTMGSPADNLGALSVGATDASDDIASFSSRGPASLPSWLGLYPAIGPDISAPGVSVRSSVPGGGYEGGWSGTSLAAPHVAGTVALMWSAEPDLVGRVAETEAILRGTAVPRTTTQECGGVPGSQVPNNTYGWGRLDALAAVEMVWQAGSLAGTVTDAGSGAPVAGAEIRMERNGYTLTTAADPVGVYDFPLGQGTYTVTVEAYGYAAWMQMEVDITQDMTTTLGVDLTPLLTYTLSGFVTEGGLQAAGDPVWGQVGVQGTSILETTDPATGYYSATIAAGSHNLRAVARGYVAENRAITVTGDLSESIGLEPRWTYYVRDSRSACGPAFEWIDATDGTPHDVAFWSYFLLYEPGLPPFRYYNSAYSYCFVSSFGFLSFGQGYPRSYQDEPQLVVPFEGPPNNVIYGFGQHLDSDLGAQGMIYHKVVDDRTLVVEFHQVEHWPGGNPETFEFILDTETGVIKLQYLALSQPEWATVGVENADGSDGLAYSYHNSGNITDSLAVEFYPVYGPPPADQDEAGVRGTLSGTVYVSGTVRPMPRPVPGALVTATSFLRSLTTTTDAAGEYLLPDTCADLYTLEAGAEGYHPGEPAQGRLRWPGDVAVTDLYLEPLPAAPSLTKEVAPAEVLPGGLLTYTLSLANEGPGPLFGAVLSDTLPWQVEYVTSTPPGSFQDGTLTWTVDIMPDGADEVIIAGVLTSTAEPGTAVTNTAWLRWDGEAISDYAVLYVLQPMHAIYLPVVLRGSP